MVTPRHGVDHAADERAADEGRRGWDRARNPHNLYLSSIVEAVGLALADRTLELPPEVIERAGRVQKERNP